VDDVCYVRVTIVVIICATTVNGNTNIHAMDHVGLELDVTLGIRGIVTIFMMVHCQFQGRDQGQNQVQDQGQDQDQDHLQDERGI